jgi:hypothetical protein
MIEKIIKSLIKYSIAAIILTLTLSYMVTIVLSLLSVSNAELIKTGLQFAFILVLFGVILVLIRKKWIQSVSENKFVIGVNILSVVLACIAFLLFKSELSGDPEDYYNAASRILDGVMPWNYDGIFYKRTLVYFLPLMSISRSILFLFAMNTVVSCATAFILYRILKMHISDALTPRLFYLLYTVLPLRITSLHYPSHDVPALFLFAIILYILSYSLTNAGILKMPKAFAVAILAGLVFWLLEVQRSLGLIISMSFLVFGIIHLFSKNQHAHQTHQKRSVYVLFFLSPIIFLVLNSSFNTIAYNRVKNNIDISSPPAMIFSFNSPGSKGDYYSGIDLRYNYYKKFENNQEALKYGIANYISDWKNNPTGKLKTLATKSYVLNNFSFFRYINYDNNDELKALHYFYSSLGRPIRVFVLIFVIIGAWGFYLKTRQNKYLLIFLLLYIFIFSSSLVFLSEVSPDYTNLIIPCLLVFATIGLVKVGQIKIRVLSLSYKPLIPIVITCARGVVLLFIIGLCLVLGSAVLPFKTISFQTCDISIDDKSITNYKACHVDSSILLLTELNSSNIVNIKNISQNRTAKLFIEYPTHVTYAIKNNNSIEKIVHDTNKISPTNYNDKSKKVNLVRLKNDLNQKLNIDLSFSNIAVNDTIKVKYVYLEK